MLLIFDIVIEGSAACDEVKSWSMKLHLIQCVRIVMSWLYKNI